MSAPENLHGVASLAIRAMQAEILEVAALRAGGERAQRFGAACGESLPAFGCVTHAAPRLVLCVRPARWLLLDPRPGELAGARAARWRTGCAGSAAVTELSSALTGFALVGGAVRELLARGCRLDLRAKSFPAGTAAATVMAQVSVTLAALPRGMLLLTPSTTARHFAEWLGTTAGPFADTQCVRIEELL